MADEVLSTVLLESGTNELEVMEFKIGERSFGINVAKVMEILRYTEIIPMPNSSPYVEGIFKPRNKIMTVVNLAKYLNLEEPKGDNTDIFIIAKFNNFSTAFHVLSVEGIRRISWTDIDKPDPTIYGEDDGIATGIARFDGRLITIIDFEKILSEINPESAIKISDMQDASLRSKVSKPIMVVEDSPILLRMIVESLKNMGYMNITIATNGKEAIEQLYKYKEQGGKITDHCSLVVTDIEMPQMDGHRLIKLIRDDEILKSLPTIIFSSLISDEMRLKGNEVGATAQVPKPEIATLVQKIDEHIF